MGERQLNLFGFEGQRPPLKRPHSILLPLDTLIILLVVVVLLLTITFSLGVERGRKMVRRGGGEEKDFKLEAKKIDIPAAIKDIRQPKVETEKKREIIEVKKDNFQSVASDKYIIQVATYAREDIALEEVRKLQEKGFPAGLSEKGKYLVIIVGGFDSKAEAEENLKQLKSRYKDCFIKKQ